MYMYASQSVVVERESIAPTCLESDFVERQTLGIDLLVL